MRLFRTITMVVLIFAALSNKENINYIVLDMGIIITLALENIVDKLTEISGKLEK